MRPLYFLAAAAFLLAPPAVRAHDADCPVCKLKVLQDTREQDNEVVLRYGRKRIEYRCIRCALQDSQSAAFAGDLLILAPSEKKAQPVLIERKAGKWSTRAGVVFLDAPSEHRFCSQSHRAFHQRAGFDTYVLKNREAFQAASPLTLEQMLARVRPEANP